MQQKSFTKTENNVVSQSCTRCEEYKTLATSFHKDKKEPLGFMTLCKQCRKEEQANKPKARKRYYKLDGNCLIERECTSCREVKSAEAFSSHSACPGGRYTVCKGCKSSRDKQYSKNNSAKKKESDRKYYAAESHRIRANARKWKKENRDKCVNYDKRVARSPIHREFSKDIRKLKQFVKAENACAANVIEKYSLDHIIPLKHDLVSGLNVPWNIQILTWSENSCKSNKFDGTEDNNSWREDYLRYLQLRSVAHE